MAMRPGAKMTADRLPQVKAALEQLVRQEVLVGIPASAAPRAGEEINNAAIGYIHEFGAPEASIPARPHLVPGIRKALPAIGRKLSAGAAKAVWGDVKAGERALVACGMLAQTSIVATLNAGVPPPLADSTLRERAARHPTRTAEKAELARRASGQLPSTELVKPLIDTAAYKQAITFVVRRRGARVKA